MFFYSKMTLSYFYSYLYSVYLFGTTRYFVAKQRISQTTIPKSKAHWISILIRISQHNWSVIFNYRSSRVSVFISCPYVRLNRNWHVVSQNFKKTFFIEMEVTILRAISLTNGIFTFVYDQSIRVCRLYLTLIEHIDIEFI